MKHRSHSTWLSYRMTPLYCIDFSGYGSDRDGVCSEIAIVEAVLAHQPAGSLLSTIDLSQTELFPEILAFIDRAAREAYPFRKLAFLGLSAFKRFKLKTFQYVLWPKNAAFFEAYEPAKAWLVSEAF